MERKKRSRERQPNQSVGLVFRERVRKRSLKREGARGVEGLKKKKR